MSRLSVISIMQADTPRRRGSSFPAAIALALLLHLLLLYLPPAARNDSGNVRTVRLSLQAHERPAVELERESEARHTRRVPAGMA